MRIIQVVKCRKKNIKTAKNSHSLQKKNESFTLLTKTKHSTSIRHRISVVFLGHFLFEFDKAFDFVEQGVDVLELTVDGRVTDVRNFIYAL